MAEMTPEERAEHIEALGPPVYKDKTLWFRSDKVLARISAAEAELERTQAILTEVWVAATRARNALHAHNRPRFPAKLRTEVRDILDKALENSND